MKKIFYTFILLFVFVEVYGQKLKFKQVYDSILYYNSNQNYQKSILLLKKYTARNPSDINALIQLAICYEAVTKESCNQLIFFEKAINTYTEINKNITQQTKINKKFVRNIPELAKFDKITPQIIINFTAKRKKNLDLKYKLLKKECFYRKKAENAYLSAKKNFFLLKKKFPQYSQLLLSDVNFTSKTLDSIKIYYDSTIYFFQQYRIAHENVNSKSKPAFIIPQKIIDYENFTDTSANFFNDTVKIFNYKSWALKIQKTLNSEIFDIRKNIEVQYASMLKILINLQDTTFVKLNPDTLNPAGLIAQIEQTDKNSLVSELLKFNFLKIKFYFLRNKILSDSQIYKSFENITFIFPQLIESADIIDNRTNKTNYAKYKEFFYKFFGSYTNLNNYPQEEKLFLESGFQKIENKFYTKCLKALCPGNDTLNGIPLKADFYASNTGKTATLFSLKKDKKLFLAGQKNKNNFKIPFYAIVRDDSIIEMKTQALPGSHCLFFEEKNNNRLLIIQHKKQSFISLNSLKFKLEEQTPVFAAIISDTTAIIFAKDSINFDANGIFLITIDFKNQKFRTDTIEANGFPVYYDEEENKLFLICDYYYGKKYSNPLLIILKADSPSNPKKYPDIKGICAIKKYDKNKYFILKSNSNKLPPYLQTPIPEGFEFVY